MEIQEVNGKIIINLDNYGYLMFEPLARFNSNQRYSVTFKINNAMVINAKTISSVIKKNKMFEYEIINVIENMKRTLNNIQGEIKNG